MGRDVIIKNLDGWYISTDFLLILMDLGFYEGTGLIWRVWSPYNIINTPMMSHVISCIMSHYITKIHITLVVYLNLGRNCDCSRI